MLTYHNALEIVKSVTYKLSTEKVNIIDAWNRILAEEVYSDLNMPPFRKSAMDGYACKRADLVRPLKVLGLIQAGSDASYTVHDGECVKIMTGAPLPEGADTVIMVEYTEEIDENTIKFTGTNTKKNYCELGEDVKEGDTVLSPGTLLKPKHLAVLASVGYNNVLVYKLPRVVLFSTGDELVEPAVKPSEAQIRNSNAYNLLAQLKEIGIEATYGGILVDDKDAMHKVLKDAVDNNDVVIMSGGASFSEFDYVPEVLSELGMQLKLDHMATQPGKPISFSVNADNKFAFGLAGNPISTLVQFQIMVKPFLYHIMGHTYEQPIQLVPLAENMQRKRGERLLFFPVTFDSDGRARPVKFNGSAHIAGISHAEGFGLFPQGCLEMVSNDLIEVLKF